MAVMGAILEPVTEGAVDADRAFLVFADAVESQHQQVIEQSIIAEAGFACCGQLALYSAGQEGIV